MTKRGMNLFEFFFAIFFLLKITKIEILDLNWFQVFLPLIINYVVKILEFLLSTINFRQEMKEAIQDMYYDQVAKNAANKILKKK